MPDDAIRLTLPADAALAPVASVAVRAAARQVAMPDDGIERLRTAVVDAFTALARAGGDPVEIVLRPHDGGMRVEVGGTTVE